MTLGATHYIGIGLTLAMILAVGIISGRRVRCAADFDSGGKSGATMVAGAIMGTLVGGSSTVGTAQLAYTNGMSAWWFTLGGGISCLILALFFVLPMRRSGCSTMTGLIAREFGPGAGRLASVLSSLGIFINLIAQLIAAQALIITIIPGAGLFPSTLFAAMLMAVYVIFGGVLAAGAVGVVKLILIYLTVVVTGMLCLTLPEGGLSAFWQALPNETYFSLISRGVGKDLGAGVSLLFGVLATQSYAQAVLSGRNDRAARGGALISAIMIPPIGAGGILVGMFMKLNYPGINSAQAFPLFVEYHTPPLIGGIILATLLIAVVGTGAGLSLGISTVIGSDIIKKMTSRFAAPEKSLLLSRIIIIAVLTSAVMLTTVGLGNIILDFSFMSMALRAAVVFCPMCAALFLPGRGDARFALAAVILGPLFVLAGKLARISFDPLFLGLAAALFCILLGMVFNCQRRRIKKI